MGAIRIRFAGDQIGPKFEKNLKRQSERVSRSIFGAAQDMALEFLRRGRENIAAAGNFKSPRWQNGLFANVTRGGGNVVVGIGHRVSYWMVFQKGATIRGKPLLWIPLSFASDAQGVRARDYPGRLFRVNRKNGLAPLLLSKATGEPKYFGKTSVRIPKKFKVLEIGRAMARRLNVFYKERFRKEKR